MGSCSSYGQGNEFLYNNLLTNNLKPIELLIRIAGAKGAWNFICAQLFVYAAYVVVTGAE